MKTIFLSSTGMYCREVVAEMLKILPEPADQVELAHIITASKAEEDTFYLRRDKKEMLKLGFNVEDIDIEEKNEADLRKLLKAKGITKWKLSKDTGITYRSIVNWQNQSCYPSDENTITVAQYLGLISPAETELMAIKNLLHEVHDRLDKLENN